MMLTHSQPQTLGGRNASRKQPTRHTQFMFIDCDWNNGGINAKPDKVVRSFVMKTARHKKVWSTRPKSPKTDPYILTRPRRRSSSRNTTIIEQLHTTDSSLPLECNANFPTCDARPVSSASSRSNSIISHCSGERTCSSPRSSLTSPCAEFDYSNDAYDFPLPQQKLPPRRDSFDVRALRSFDCLVVRLDADAERLLHRCEFVITQT